MWKKNKKNKTGTVSHHCDSPCQRITYLLLEPEIGVPFGPTLAVINSLCREAMFRFDNNFPSSAIKTELHAGFYLCG